MYIYEENRMLKIHIIYNIKLSVSYNVDKMLSLTDYSMSGVGTSKIMCCPGIGDTLRCQSQVTS